MPGNALARAHIYPGAALDLQSFFFSSTCLSHSCFMFVLLTSNIQRSLYLAEYEILTAGPNYGEYPLLGCDIFRGNGSTDKNKTMVTVSDSDNPSTGLAGDTVQYTQRPHTVPPCSRRLECAVSPNNQRPPLSSLHHF
jgi:hypothetical protein